MSEARHHRLPIKTDKHSVLSPKRLFGLPDLGRPYIYMDRTVISARYQELKDAMPQADIHYAMKCNPDRPVLEHIRSLGGSFEIASFNELHGLLTISVNPAEVLFSNPVKSEADIKRAYEAGIRSFAFQSVDELHKLHKYAPGANVYLRLQTPAANSTVQSEGKFGIPINNNNERLEAALLLKQVRQLSLNPYGLAFHVGSQMEHAKAWENAIKPIARLMLLLEKYDIRVAMLDMGGGFPAYHKVGLPPLAAFGASINKALDALPYKLQKIVLEPGRGLVGDAGVLIAKVIGKAFRNGKWWLYLDVGAFNGLMEALETNTALQYPMADSKQSKQLTRYMVTGPSCDSQDTISKGQLLSANLESGDRVVIYTAGAYTAAYASRFNGFEPPYVVYAPAT